MPPNMVVSEDYEQDGFLKSINLIRICQNVVGSCRISLDGDRIIPRSRIQNLKLLFWVCLATYLYYLSLAVTDVSTTSYRSIALNIGLSAVSFYSEILFIITSSRDAVYLMTECQKIGEKQKIKQRRARDWMTYFTMLTLLQFMLRAITIVQYTENIKSFAVKSRFNLFLSYLIELDVLMWVQVCNYLRSHLQVINVDLRKRARSIHCGDFSRHTYVCIYERCTYCLMYVLKIFKWSLLIFYINFLIWTINLIRSMASIADMTELYILLYILGKELLLLLVISHTTESYGRALEDTAQICYDILDHHDTGELAEFAAVALRLWREAPPPSSACGLHLDLKLLFQFVAQVITFTVVELQFSNFNNSQ